VNTTKMLTHVRCELALHQLRDADGLPLLLLHGLGERTPAEVPSIFEEWRGPIWGLDFTGHGASSRTPGGGYTAEILMADVDVALAELGKVAIVGRGLGGYIGLLIAGARPELVSGLVICDGPGLAGGGPTPHSPAVISPPSTSPAALPSVLPSTTSGPENPDPFALVELATDVRPDDYATTYARQAVQFSGLEAPITIAAVVRPSWLAAVAAEPGVVTKTLSQGLERYWQP